MDFKDQIRIIGKRVKMITGSNITTSEEIKPVVIIPFMKELGLLLCISLLISCTLTTKRVTVNELAVTGGLEYYQGKPFTGVAFEMWNENQLKLECGYKDGKKHGACKKYYENGQIELDCNYNNGLEDGAWKKYYENGQIALDCNYNNGVEDGAYKTYTKSGRLEYDLKESGSYVRYNEFGRISVEGYDDDTVSWQKFYSESGQIETEKYINKNMNHWKRYNWCGKISIDDIEYKDSTLVRREYTYNDDDSQLIEERVYMGTLDINGRHNLKLVKIIKDGIVNSNPIIEEENVKQIKSNAGEDEAAEAAKVAK